jgi:hypothetical protein
LKIISTEGDFVQKTISATVSFDNKPVLAELRVKISGRVLKLPLVVVQVLISNPLPPAKAFIPGKPRDLGAFPNQNVTIDNQVLKSTFKGIEAGDFKNKKWGLGWKARVVLHGPSRGKEENLGIGNIEVGFIQHAKIISERAGFPTIKTDLVSTAESLKYLLDVSPGETGPYYVYTQGRDHFRGDFFSNSAVIGADDTPLATIPILFKGKIAQWISIEEQFKLDVVASSEAEFTPTDNLYWVRATAAWEFSGTGTITNNINQEYPWNPSNFPVGNTAPLSWKQVSSIVQEDTKGPIVGKLGAAKKWISQSL